MKANQSEVLRETQLEHIRQLSYYQAGNSLAHSLERVSVKPFCHMHKYLAVASRRRLKGSQLGSSGQPGIQGSGRHAQTRLALAHLPCLFLKQRYCILALLLPCTIRAY